VTIECARHAWPGGTGASSAVAGPPYPHYDATAELVTFLLAHPRR
jgi:poly(3-hydroxybutyrate) depolymerase